MTTVASNKMSISLLTNDDSKILGRKPKTPRESFQTNKYQTINSNWTPLTNKSANKSVFEDRVELICNWFDLWNDKQRKWFLLSILGRCRTPQISYVQEFFEENKIIERRDFTQVLPKNLSLYVFSYLSPKDLCRCSQVSSHWKYLTEHDDVWMPKCMKFGWFLPYTPFEREVGAWKFHYKNCILSISAEPLEKDDAKRFRETVLKRELTVNEKENSIYLATKNRLNSEENYDIIVSRKPWRPSTVKPQDLKKSDAMLYSNLNPNFKNQENNIECIYKTRFGLPKTTDTSFSLLKSTSKLNAKSLNDLSKSLPLQISTMREDYNNLRKSESDLRRQYYNTEANLTALLNYNKTNRMLDNKTVVAKTHDASSTSNPNVIFISSRVPCSSLLLECVKLGIITIPYDFEMTNVNTLLRYLDNALSGRVAKNVGFFLHNDKPGQIAIVKDAVLYKVNANANEISNFFNGLVTRLDQAHSKVDFFVPLGCTVDGLELINMLHEMLGVTIRAPTGYLENFKYIQSKWLNCIDDKNTPTGEYFNEQKFNTWLYCCEILQEANIRLTSTVFSNYSDHTNKIAIDRIVGRLMFDSINEIELINNPSMRNQLIKMISASLKNKERPFYEKLSEEINKVIASNKSNRIEHAKSIETLESARSEDIKETSEISTARDLPSHRADTESVQEDSPDIMRSDVSLKKFLRYRTNVEVIEPNMRSQIVLNLVKSEISYMQSLEIVQRYYARPLKASNESGRSIVSSRVTELLFADLSLIYQITKEMVKEFNFRLKNWSCEMCVVDVMRIMSNQILVYTNYANNYDTIINTLDKLMSSNHKFRAFLNKVDQTYCTNMMTIQQLMAIPWSRLKEYIYYLSALQTHTAKDHADQANVDHVLRILKDLNFYVKQLQDRIEKRSKMIQTQRSIINCPGIIKTGRYLMLQQNAMLLNKTYSYVKDITCFIFNDLLVLAYRIRKHFPFLKYIEDSLIFYDTIEDLSILYIDDILDLKYASNIVHLKMAYKDYYISFDSYENKYNFLNILKYAKQLSVPKA